MYTTLSVGDYGQCARSDMHDAVTYGEGLAVRPMQRIKNRFQYYMGIYGISPH
jgi:hypothetical protein